MEYQDEILLYGPNGILKFYENEENKNIFFNIVNQKSSISLRLLDCLATDYSKHEDIYYILNNRIFQINSEYKNQLNAYSKERFDPFCRRERIYYNFKKNSFDTESNDDNILTTIGQLNFFRWAISNKIIEYAIQHREEIEKNINSDNKKKKSSVKCKKIKVEITF